MLDVTLQLNIYILYAIYVYVACILCLFALWNLTLTRCLHFYYYYHLLCVPVCTVCLRIKEWGNNGEAQKDMYNNNYIVLYYYYILYIYIQCNIEQRPEAKGVRMHICHCANYVALQWYRHIRENQEWTDAYYYCIYYY